MRNWPLLGHGARRSLLITFVVTMPVLWAAFVGMRSGWFPIGDEALTGLSAYDVFTGHPPVMGPRTTTAFETGIESHHPGPILYYLLAPTTALSGGASWGLVLGSALITLAVIGVGVHSAHRTGGLLAAAIIGAAFLGVQWALGPEAGARPFNPYPPAFAVVTFLVLTWALLNEELGFVPHYVVVTALMAQSHVGYLPFLAGPVIVTVVVGLVRWWRRRRAIWPLKGWRPPDDGRFRWSARSALLLGALAWLPPFVELFRFSPNNLQQILTYVAADRGQPLPFEVGLRFVVGLLAPTQGGMTPAIDAAGSAGAHMVRQPAPMTAVVMGTLLVVLVAVMALAGNAWVREKYLTRGARQWLPTRRESHFAWTALLGLGALTLTVTRLPLSSTLSTWNYLQSWPVTFTVWGVVLTYVLRRVVASRRSPRWFGSTTAAVVVLSLGLSAAVLSQAPSRWHEGDGIALGWDELAGPLARIDARHEGILHVTFDGDTLGAGYYLSPALAFAMKDRYAVHLPAVWTSAEDTDFRKTVTAPEDSAWVSIRSGDLGAGAEGVNPSATVVTTVTDRGGHEYTLFVRGPEPL